MQGGASFVYQAEGHRGGVPQQLFVKKRKNLQNKRTLQNVAHSTLGNAGGKKK
jgi:hypothetical protein